MQETSLSYDEIIAHFGVDTVKDRYAYLYDKMNDYITLIGQEEFLYVNESLLQQAVLDYFADIYRLKSFHKIDNANATKIISYEVYWLWRRKPIQLKDNCDVIFPNESFLSVFVTHELLVPEETDPLDDSQYDTFSKFITHFNYHLKYRAVDKQSLEMALLAFETSKAVWKNKNY